VFKNILFCLCGWFSYAYAAPESELHIVYQLLKDKKLFSISPFTGENNLSLKYLKFGEKKGSKGSLIFVNGMGENVVMYLELFYDLHSQGWSPIYTYDHRGQGLSGRILPDPHVGYVEDWSFYRKDLNTFIQLVLSDPQVDHQNLFLVGNSMGAAIVVDYFQHIPGQQDIFSSVLLAAPFFGLHARGFGFAVPVFPHVIRFFCLFRNCLSPIVGPNSRQLRPEVAQNRITSSRERYDLFVRSAKMYSAGYTVPSLDWLIQAFHMNRRVMNQENIFKITLPLLILQAEKDNVVSNLRQKRFCRKIKNCSLKVIEGRHDHFIEADKIRNQVVLETVQFFQSYYQ